MIAWFVDNLDSFIVNIIVAILFLPISYWVNVALDNQRLNNISKDTSQENKEFSKYTREYVIITKPVPINPKVENNNEIIWFVFLLAVFTIIYYTYKDIFLISVYLLSMFGFIFNLVALLRLFKGKFFQFVSFYLFLALFITGYIVYALFLIENPMFISDKALVTIENIEQGRAILQGGLGAFIELMYGVLGYIFLIGLIIFSLGLGIFIMIIMSSSYKAYKWNIINNFIMKIQIFYTSKVRCILLSFLLIIINFLLQSGLMIKLIMYINGIVI